MIGGRSALLGASGNPYGNWTGNYSDVSLLLRGASTPVPVEANPPVDEGPTPKTVTAIGNASVTAAVAKWPSGSSLAFDGSGDYFSIPDGNDFNYGSGNFTAEAFVYPAASPNQPIIMGQWDGTGGGTGLSWVLILSNDSTRRLRFLLSTNGSGVVGDFVSSSALALNDWNHVALVRNGDVFTAYLNGVSAVSYTISAGASLFNATNSITVGGSSTGGQFFNGFIDDLRITKGIARYTANFTPPTAELPANVTDDPSYNSVSLLLRKGTPTGSIIDVALDESPTPKPIRLVGTPTISTTTFKYGGSALSFAGNGSYLTVPDSIAFRLGLLNEPFTVEFYFYLNTAGDFGLLSRGGGFSGWVNSDGYHYLASIGSGILYWQWNATNASFYPAQITTSAPSSGQWHHYAASYDGSITRLFLNGVLAGTSSAPYVTPSSANRVRIGASSVDSNLASLNGLIDDLRITKGIARYTKNFLPPPAQLPAI